MYIIVGRSWFYGLDWDGPTPMDEEPDHVTVAAMENPLSIEDYEVLCTTVDPLSPSSYYGIDLYLAVLSFVHSKL